MVLSSETVTRLNQLHTVKQKFTNQRDIEWVYSTYCLAKSQTNYMVIILLKKH
jgi:hypothetical protein